MTCYLSNSFHVENINMQSLFTYLKLFVSKKNANKVVKMFTSCRFIPVSVILWKISPKRFQKEARTKYLSIVQIQNLAGI